MNDQKHIEYREKYFQAETGTPYGGGLPGEIRLSVTHNGRQWSSISLLPKEVSEVIRVLTKHQVMSHIKEDKQ